jgi:hypothetical protein
LGLNRTCATFGRRAYTVTNTELIGLLDAAGEGVNLQFCWLMVNYEVPWNPARLEQRDAARDDEFDCDRRPPGLAK